MTALEEFTSYTVPLVKIGRFSINEGDYQTWENSLQEVTKRAEGLNHEQRELLLSTQTNPWLLHQLSQAAWREDRPDLDREAAYGLDPESLTAPVTVTLALSHEVIEELRARADDQQTDEGDVMSRLIGIPNWVSKVFE